MNPHITKKRLLITGGSGLLALNWACAMRSTWDVTLVTHQHAVKLAQIATIQTALDSPQQLLAQFSKHAPNVIVHAAGLTSVDECERSPERAHHANVEIAKQVAHAAACLAIPFIHISTDHLFSGHHSLSTETTLVQPLNQYAITKALAEAEVQKVNPAALIIRTNFFGWGHASRQSFSDWLINNLRANQDLPLFTDVFFTPILADALAFTAHELLEGGASGIFNVVGDERLSKYEFALLLADQFSLPRERIQPKQLNGSHLVARRPRDMSLDNQKARHALKRPLGGISSFLIELQTHERAGRPAELLNAVQP
jgi:dTDP-4-dehydrorhamnose reductase